MNQVEVKRHRIEGFAHLLGMIALLVLGSCTGEEGLSYFAAAFEFYSFLWTFVGGSVSDCLGRMLRERGRSQYRNTTRLRRYVMIFQGGLGMAAALAAALFGGAVVTGVFHIPHASFLTLLLAPALVLKSLESVMLGYFQGSGSELPTAATGVFRQVSVLGFGLLFGNLLKRRGRKVSALYGLETFTGMYGAIGVALAVLLTEIILFVFLLILYRSSGRNNIAERDSMRGADRFGGVVQGRYGNMGPHILVRLLQRLPIWVGLALFGRVLSLGGTEAAYGVYYGKYLALAGSFVFLMDLMSVPLSAKAYSCIRREDLRYGEAVFQVGFHGVVVYGLFFSACMAAMGGDIGTLVCGGREEIAGAMFCGGSFIILFVSLSRYFGRILMLMRKYILLLAALGVMNLVFLTSALLFLNLGKLGIMAYVYGGLVAGGVLCGILGFLVFWILGIRVDWLQTVLVPAVCACGVGVLCLFVSKALTPHLGEAASVLGCLAGALILYIALLTLLRNFREQEFKHLPGGQWIKMLMQMFHVRF